MTKTAWTVSIAGLVVNASMAAWFFVQGGTINRVLAIGMNLPAAALCVAALVWLRRATKGVPR